MNRAVETTINTLGASLFAFLFMARIVQAARGDAVAFLLAGQSGMAAFLLVFHRPARKTSSPFQYTLAWTCAWFPLAFKTDGTVWLSIPGLLLTLWSLAVLGSSFSIAPEDRGLIARGPYQIIRHPMYSGELLSCIGLSISSRSLWNWLVLAAFGLMLIVRIKAEENILTGYADYARAVRWKLVPGVW